VAARPAKVASVSANEFEKPAEFDGDRAQPVARRQPRRRMVKEIGFGQTRPAAALKAIANPQPVRALQATFHVSARQIYCDPIHLTAAIAITGHGAPRHILLLAARTIRNS